MSSSARRKAAPSKAAFRRADVIVSCISGSGSAPCLHSACAGTLFHLFFRVCFPLFSPHAVPKSADLFILFHNQALQSGYRCLQLLNLFRHTESRPHFIFILKRNLEYNTCLMFFIRLPIRTGCTKKGTDILISPSKNMP